jgi:molybdopterin molybdotransferase
MPPPEPEPIAPRFHDPRMRGFRTRTAVEEVVGLIDARVAALGPETVPLAESAGCVLARPIQADRPVPPFDRAAMDGYALRGEETFGADPYNPAAFFLVGRARPGRPFDGEVGPGQAVEIATGAPLPRGADAVAKVEGTRREAGSDRLQVVEPSPPGRHVGRRGEDVAPGSLLLPDGRVLRPQDLGILSAQAIASVPVVRRPSVAVLVTGDELLPPAAPPEASRIADMNSPMLAALIARDGGLPHVVGPLKDDRDALRAAIAELADAHDALLISGGSSTGPEDHAPTLVAELGALHVHGVALRPASPTGLGFVGEAPVLLLPGNPVSCLCAYDFFAGRVVRRLAGRAPAWPYRSTRAPLAAKLTSALGRVDYARVRIGPDGVEPLATSGASILSSTTRADGFVVVPAGSEGYPAGAEVCVWLYDLGL